MRTPVQLLPAAYPQPQFGISSWLPKRRRDESALTDADLAEVLFPKHLPQCEDHRQALMHAFVSDRQKNRRSLKTLAILLLLSNLGWGGIFAVTQWLNLNQEQPMAASVNFSYMTHEYDEASITDASVAQRAIAQRLLAINEQGPSGNLSRQMKDVAAYAQPAVAAVHVTLGERSGTGSGFFYRADGILVTNNHVVQNQDNVEVLLLNGKKAAGKVIARDPHQDLALIQVSPEDFELQAFPTLNLSDDGPPEEGEWVMAIGHASGLEWTTTAGIVSSNNKRTQDKKTLLIQTDTPINAGNSGGPLVNLAGKVVAINTITAFPLDGISHSVSAKDIRAFAEDTLSPPTS